MRQIIMIKRLPPFVFAAFMNFPTNLSCVSGDETVSMVSDTWSTDVLASDSEIVEQQDRILLPVPPEQVAPVLPSEPAPSMFDISETASEAWSTDVLASDSERLTEVDTDDTASVARYVITHCITLIRSLRYLFNHLNKITSQLAIFTTQI